MILDTLLGDDSKSTFCKRHLFTQPFSRPGGCHEFLKFGNRDVFERLLASESAEIFVGDGSDSSTGTHRPTSWSHAEQILNQGATIAVRHAERHDPGLAALARLFQEEFLSPIDIHFFCTPAGIPGFNWHYDAEEVFVLQTVGAKEWWLRKNTVNPWPLIETLPQDMQYEREIMPVMRCSLRAGDWLYVPNGYWHRTAASELSFSLSIGIMAPTALDLLDFIRHQLVDSLRWRQRFQSFGVERNCTEVPAEYCDVLAGLAGEIGNLLRDPRVLRNFFEHRRQCNGDQPAAP
jgi:50S ribosomal protein L16 3-hydroxylase